MQNHLGQPMLDYVCMASLLVMIIYHNLIFIIIILLIMIIMIIKMITMVFIMMSNRGAMPF